MLFMKACRLILCEGRWENQKDVKFTRAPESLSYVQQQLFLNVLGAI